ncbi:MAG: hypothetical protein ACYDIE_02635 [Candidatus Krumholzibacteriia bacterium]
MRRLAADLAAAIVAALLGAVAGGAGRPVAAAPAPAEASPDTATALLSGVAGTAAPRAILVWPDTVSFGDPLWVALVGGPSPAAPPATGADWLVWDAPEGARERAGDRVRVAPPRDWPPRGAGARVVGRARAYRAGPLRLGWAGRPDLCSAVVVVRPRLTEATPPAPVRDPRGLGWRSRRVALLALLVAGLLALLARRRRRRRAPGGPLDAPRPPPAYLAAARALLALRDEALPARGEGRRCLDRLAEEIRLYLRARYRVPAPTLTPEEIASSLTALGHPAPLAIACRRLLAACDERRFAPGAASPAACGTLLAEAVALIAAGRVPARFTVVPAPLLVAGEAAWARLDAPAGGERPAGAADGEGRDA